MTTLRYPGATWKPTIGSDGKPRDGGSFEGDDPGVAKGVIHTTETGWLPSYSNPPHNTIGYRDGDVSRWQHIEYDRAGRALVNLPGGEQTNREDRTFQLEVICYSAKQFVTREGRWWSGDLPDPLLEAVAEWMSFIEDEFGVEHQWPERQALSSTQANAAGFRMSTYEWDKWPGWCGHQHVPENSHWDPGALEWDRLMAMGGEQGYKTVLHVPDVDWAYGVTDRQIDRRVIVTEDAYADDWENLNMTDGRMWTMLDRLIRPVEARLAAAEERLDELEGT